MACRLRLRRPVVFRASGGVIRASTAAEVMREEALEGLCETVGADRSARAGHARAVELTRPRSVGPSRPVMSMKGGRRYSVVRDAVGADMGDRDTSDAERIARYLHLCDVLPDEVVVSANGYASTKLARYKRDALLEVLAPFRT